MVYVLAVHALRQQIRKYKKVHSCSKLEYILKDFERDCDADYFEQIRTLIIDELDYYTFF